MLVLLFALCVASYTVFENIFVLFLVVLLIMLGFLIARHVGMSKYATKKTMVLLLVAVVLSISTVYIKNHNYIPLVGEKYFIGTGVVSSLYKNETVVFSTPEQEFLLKADKKHAIGDEVFVSGIINTTYDNTDFFDFVQQWENFISGNFLDEIRRYEFSYPKRLFMKGIAAHMYEQNSVLVSEDNTTFVQKMRANMYTKINNLYGVNRNSGLLLGMLIGDRYQIPSDAYQTFQESGLVHIIAVSGGNIVIIVIFLGFLFFRVPFYVRKFVIAGAILLYAFVCGMDSSIVRATIMGLLSILAIFAGREVTIYRSMKYAFVLMLLYNPYFLVYDVGFILSFSAIIGILVFDSYFPLVYQKATTWQQKIKKSFLAMLYPTLGATIGVLPILLFYMGNYNVLGILANIVVLPIVGLVMILGFVTSYINSIVSLPFLAYPVNILLEYIYNISDIISRWGIYIDISALRLKYVVLIFWLGYVIWFLLRGEKNTLIDGQEGEKRDNKKHRKQKRMV